jgi:hypothetical protein
MLKKKYNKTQRLETPRRDISKWKQVEHIYFRRPMLREIMTKAIEIEDKRVYEWIFGPALAVPGFVNFPAE